MKTTLSKRSCGGKVFKMFCTKCGNQLNEGTVFCPKCGTKVGASEASAAAEPEVIVKSKKELIYESFCRFMTRNPMLVGINPSFGELENYEEGAGGMVYCELVASSRNSLGKTKKTRFGAVIQEVEADGNVVFKGAGPQLITPISTSKMTQKLCGFKKG